MTEALPIAPEPLDGNQPSSSLPSIPEVPYHFQKRTLLKIREEEGRVPENLWTGRGDAVEVRTHRIIESQDMIVKKIRRNPPFTKGSDSVIEEFTEGFSVQKPVLLEIKSSTIGKRARKQKIRDIILSEDSNGQLLAPWTKQFAMNEWNKLSHDEMEAAISKWLTDNRVILINGGEEDKEEKTKEEILTESFFPQLERIWLKDRGLEDKPEPIQIFPEIIQFSQIPGQIQLFPEAA